MSAKLQRVLCVLLHNNTRSSVSVNRLEGPKQVILAASGDSWMEQSPLGVCPLLHIIQVLTVVIYLWFNSMSVFLFRKYAQWLQCLIITIFYYLCFELSIWKLFVSRLNIYRVYWKIVIYSSNRRRLQFSSFEVVV